MDKYLKLCFHLFRMREALAAADESLQKDTSIETQLKHMMAVANYEFAVRVHADFYEDLEEELRTGVDMLHKELSESKDMSAPLSERGYLVGRMAFGLGIVRPHEL